MMFKSLEEAIVIIDSIAANDYQSHNVELWLKEKL